MSAFENVTFSAPPERCTRFTARILQHVDASRPLRILDIGCGTGEQLFQLATALPAARLTGVDVSAPSIDVARRRAEQLRLGITFVAADYRELTIPPQDAIVSYSTLHLIPGDTRALFRKVASELAGGGLLMNVMPFECAYNTALSGVRTAFSAVRSGLTDALIFRTAKLMHRNASEEFLRERVAYMYQRLERLDGRGLRHLMESECGLHFVAEAPEPHASLAQPKHRLSIFRKR